MSFVPALSAEALIRDLGLSPHPEGGHYRETFRSARTVQTPRGPRAALTSIHFLLAAGEVSRWHAVEADETWYFHEGAPLELFLAPPDGARLEVVRLGPVGQGNRPSHTVPAGWWQAARPTGAFSLVGCAVGPGFDFADFRMASDQAAVMEALARLPAPSSALL